MVRVHEGTGDALLVGRLFGDPHDPAVAEHFLRDREEGHADAAENEGHDESIEDDKSRFVLAIARPPRERHENREGTQADGKAAQSGGDVVGREGQRTPDRPATAARPSVENLAVQASGRWRESFDQRRRQRRRHEQRQRGERGERGQPRNRGPAVTPPPLPNRDGKQAEDGETTHRHADGLPPSEKKRQQEDESLQGAKNPPVGPPHPAVSSASSRPDSRPAADE